MKVNWKAFGRLGLNIVEQVVPAVGTAERIVVDLKKPHTGQEKQDLAFALVKASLESAEDIAGKDLLSDPDVEQATRGVIDATVALQNIIAAKRGQPKPPAFDAVGRA